MTEQKNSFDLVKFLTKYAMVIALVVVFVLFAVLTKGMMVQPQNMSNLLLQQGYVLVLACGMLLCILTGGNIDLSVGSVICMVGGIAAVLVTNMHLPAIPVMLLWVVAVCLIYNFITARTAFGRYFYAVGGNEKATKLSGINTDKIYFIAYANMGLLAGLCGLLVAARIGSVDGNTGTSYEMDAIGSCFIGGASAYGGSGTVGGVVIGALLLGVINMGMSIMGLPDAWKYVIKGGVLLVAVIFDVVTSRKSGAK